MLHEYMDLSRLMVNAQMVEVIRLRKKNREPKQVMSSESGSSKSRIIVKVKPKFKKRFSSKFLQINRRISIIKFFISYLKKGGMLITE